MTIQWNDIKPGDTFDIELETPIDIYRRIVEDSERLFSSKYNSATCLDRFVEELLTNVYEMPYDISLFRTTLSDDYADNNDIVKTRISGLVISSSGVTISVKSVTEIVDESNNGKIPFGSTGVLINNQDEFRDGVELVQVDFDDYGYWNVWRREIEVISRQP